jgi:hypothetical protein
MKDNDKVRVTATHSKRYRRFCGFLIGSLLLASALAKAVSPQRCTYQDLMPDYEQFALHTAELLPPERADAFVQQFAPRFPDFYAPEVFGDSEKMRARALRFFGSREGIAALPGVAPLAFERLTERGKVIGPQFTEQQERFVREFRDFRCDTMVEFGVSLFTFDGHPAEFSGGRHLLFGVDVIAMLHGPTDMPAFFDHEVFHLYHRQIIGTRAPQIEPAWWTLWLEGLATYVSQRMNPELSPQEVLWYPEDMVSRMTNDRARAAQLLLRDLDETGRRSGRWFLADVSVEGLPPRAGYYLGYLFAKSEGGGKALPALARMSPSIVRDHARKFLRKLASVSSP